MMRVCFGRLSQIFSQESQTIADYENMNLVRKAKAAKILKTLFSTMDIPQIWCTRLEFFPTNFDTVLVLLRTILCWSVAVRFYNTFRH